MLEGKGCTVHDIAAVIIVNCLLSHDIFLDVSVLLSWFRAVIKKSTFLPFRNTQKQPFQVS
jgi:hypothetical protein